MAVAFGRLTIPERGVARVTWFILEFYTPLNFSGMAEDRIVKFVHGLAREVLVLRLKIITQVGVVKVMWRLNFFRKITVNISKTVQNHWNMQNRDIGPILTMED